MFSSWKLGRFGGIDFYLHPTFVLFLGVVGLSNGGLASVVLLILAFACVALDEYGHAFAARLYGIATQSITLYPIGGIARLQRIPKSPGAEIVVALAGPLVNIVIAGLLWGLIRLTGLSGPTFSGPRSLPGTLLTINLGLALFNLIPAFPMDGGRVLRALLSRPLGRVCGATAVAAGIGRFLALVFAGVVLFSAESFGLKVTQLVLAGFIYLAAGAELAFVRRENFQSSSHGPSIRWIGPGTMHTPEGYRWAYQGNGFWKLAPDQSPTESAVIIVDSSSPGSSPSSSW